MNGFLFRQSTASAFHQTSQTTAAVNVKRIFPSGKNAVQPEFDRFLFRRQFCNRNAHNGPRSKERIDRCIADVSSEDFHLQIHIGKKRTEFLQIFRFQLDLGFRHVDAADGGVPAIPFLKRTAAQTLSSTARP